MPSFYSVIQYLPDPVIDERINIGVIATGEGRTRVSFVQNWARVRSFGGEDISFLQEFASQLEDMETNQLFLPGFEGGLRLNETELAQIAGSWMNSIQITRPRGSLDELDELIEEVAQRFLRESLHSPKAGRDRKTAAKLAADSVKHALAERFGESGKRLVRRNSAVEGLSDLHAVDLCAQNGRVYVAAQAISFEVRTVEELVSDADAATGKLADIRKGRQHPEVALVVIPPPASDSKIKAFKHAAAMAKTNEILFVLEHEFNEWAVGAAKTVPTAAVHNGAEPRF